MARKDQHFQISNTKKTSVESLATKFTCFFSFTPLSKNIEELTQAFLLGLVEETPEILFAARFDLAKGLF